MAVFPNTLSNRSTLERVSGVNQDQAQDGTLRFVDLGGQDNYRIECVVQALDATQVDTLLAWLKTERTNEIDVQFLGTLYRGRLLPSAPVNVRGTQGLFEVSCTIYGREA